MEGNAQKLEVDKLIVAVGRVPNTAGLGAENTGLKLDERGYIEVDAIAAPACPIICGGRRGTRPDAGA